MLEDDLEDILKKAMRGHDLNLADLGFPSTTRLQELSESELATAARVLKLNHGCLIHLYSPFKPVELPPEVTMITSRFGHLGVNAFSVRTPHQHYLIDTGTESQKVNQLNPDCILITHHHPDHVACLDEFETAILTPQCSPATFPKEVLPFDVSGHCKPALAYYFPALSKPCCFVGDSVFKRSVGGCSKQSDFRLAMTNLILLLTQLPPETILCVGHGPNTTVALETAENPFLADLL